MSEGFRFLILNTDYPEFLHWLYAQHPKLEEQSYEEQMRVRNERLFGVADFYSNNLNKLGHEANDIHANNDFMQKAWAREQGIRVEESTPVERWWQENLKKARRLARNGLLRYLRRVFHPVMSFIGGRPRSYNILAAQIKHYRPDVLLNQDMNSIGSKFLKEIRPYARLIVGQIASPLPRGEDLSCYDLIISSLPNFVDYFRGVGVPSELHRFGFEPTVLQKLKGKSEKIPVSFVGSLSAYHDGRIRLLEYLCPRLEIKIWGQGADSLPKDSPILRCYMGKAWGIEMYQTLCNSKIALNHHIDIAESYANNMRLFEATGTGALLITDWKKNLYEMFEPGREVLAYRSPEECAELIQYYLEHDIEREAIARAGQERTLREHTYYQRMQELADISRRYLRRPEMTTRKVFVNS